MTCDLCRLWAQLGSKSGDKQDQNVKSTENSETNLSTLIQTSSRVLLVVVVVVVESFAFALASLL